MRFSFVTSSEGWTPSEDAYAAFSYANTSKIFLGKTLADYSRVNGDYTWNVLRHDRKHLSFTGKDLHDKKVENKYNITPFLKCLQTSSKIPVTALFC